MLSLLPAAFAAQAPAPAAAAQREAMEQLDWMMGHWNGTGWIQLGPERHEVVQTEAIQSKLDKLVLLIEGPGRNSPGTAVVHSALAVVSYDERAGTFRWRAFTAEGRQTDAEAKVGKGGH